MHIACTGTTMHIIVVYLKLTHNLYTKLSQN